MVVGEGTSSASRMDSGPTDPLHQRSPPGVRWTTRNFAEAMPGVPSPATWSLWSAAVHRATTLNMRRMGVYSARELAALEAQGRTQLGIFFGRVAGDVGFLSGGLSRIPGFDPIAFERDFFGVESDPGTPTPTWRRAWAVLPKLIAAGARHPRQLRQLKEESDSYWRKAVQGPVDLDRVRGLAAQATGRFTWAMAVHTFQTQSAQRAYTKVASLAEAAEIPGLETRIVSGSGVLEELAVARDLWAVSRGGLPLEDFLDRHGYHGPDEGELSVPSWREDSTPVHRAAESYAEKPEEDGPEAHLTRQQLDRDLAEAQLLAAVPRRRRALAGRAIAAARTAVPLREVGKAAFLKEIDVARFALRALGRHLQERGSVDEPTDVFCLTIEEAIGAAPGEDLRPTVAARKEARARYLTMEIPGYFVGDPVPTMRQAYSGAAGGTITGMPACQGVVEGTARVVLDPALQQEPLGPDEVLVARTTDPGWVSLFMDAGGIAVDVGGPLSHAAIVARELGIPCIVNTLDGTRRIADGARVRLDGERGTIEILEGEGPQAVPTEA